MVKNYYFRWMPELLRKDVDDKKKGINMYFKNINPIKILKTDFDMFWKFYPAALTRVAFAKITKRKLRMPYYAGHWVLNHKKGNERLRELIESDEPFMFGRNGGNETYLTGEAILLENEIIDDIDKRKLEIPCAQCGLFAYDKETIIKFGYLIKNASNKCDLYGTFRWTWEDYIIKHFMQKKVQLTHANIMDFWRFEKPFTMALKGKRVLVIHPLDDEIRKQYARRTQIFKNEEWLPEFELVTLKAVQTIAGIRDERFNNWFEALAFMEQEVDKLDFDIALLGCGAYGMPLTAYIREKGKQAIYMGGVLQILFGIRGGRWDKIPEVSRLYNECWISPTASKVPKKANVVEKGCYW